MMSSENQQPEQQEQGPEFKLSGTINYEFVWTGDKMSVKYNECFQTRLIANMIARKHVGELIDLSKTKEYKKRFTSEEKAKLIKTKYSLDQIVASLANTCYEHQIAQQNGNQPPENG